MNEPISRKNNRRFRIQIGLILVFSGLIIFILGVKPDWFGADRSPIVGFVQISVFLIGLASICLGGYLALNALWNGTEKTIAADFGFRLVSTGFVISVASGMADVIGFGNQPSPAIPYFGPWQATGVMLGELIIIIGFILLIPPAHRDHKKHPKELTD
ncbi:MAG TPA: hypothetical protein VLM80_09155 [Anaerolineales bacterium]|nr:hypothetical protein [Anaerolineales bacterium]